MDRLEIAIERLRHPAPGSRVEAARDFGIDLNLLIANLKLPPAERVSRMHAACMAAEQLRGITRRRSSGTSAHLSSNLDLSYLRNSDHLRRLAPALAPYDPELESLLDAAADSGPAPV